MATSVLSFDCGLRNLAAALVRRTPAELPPQFRVLAHDAETKEEFHGRALQWFIRHAWAVQAVQLIDVTTFLDKPVKKVKQLGLVVMGQALTAALQDLHAKWFSGATLTHPSFCAVEVQHNSNAVMRAVSLAITVFFMRAWAPATQFEGVTGSQKLKLCAALGFDIGSGLQAELDKKAEKARVRAEKAAAKAAAAAARKAKAGSSKRTLFGTVLVAAVAPPPVPPPIALDTSTDEDDDTDDDDDAAIATTKRFGKRGAAPRFQAKDKYADNKLRSVLAMRFLLDGLRGAPGGLAPDIEALLADHNIADAVLQGVWVLWEQAKPRMPARKRARAAPKPK